MEPWTEKWKTIEEAPKYEVSTFGNIRNKKRPYKNLVNGVVNGYTIAYLRTNNITIKKSIHRLVAEAFIKNKESKAQVNHLNGNKQDNKASNLEWATNTENTQHAWDTGLRSRKNSVGVSKAGSKYRYQLCFQGTRYSKSGFNTLVEAKQVRDSLLDILEATLYAI